MANEFTCALCGEIYEKSWTDDEAIAEAKSLFGDNVMEHETSVVCDDCHKVLLGTNRRM